MGNICKRPVYAKASPQDKKLDEKYQAWCRKKSCGKCGGRGEYNFETGEWRCQYAHSVIGGKGGKAIKALLSGLPLCSVCHDIQHRQGHLALAPREWWIETPRKYLTQWMKETKV